MGLDRQRADLAGQQLALVPGLCATTAAGLLGPQERSGLLLPPQVGVLKQVQGLRFVAVEAGLAWAPSLGWRLDSGWERFRDELPAVKRPPSEYLRERFWYTTQPADEPEDPRHLREVFDWVGLARILFASDYPHWDFDAPDVAVPVRLEPERRERYMNRNAASLYGF